MHTHLIIGEHRHPANRTLFWVRTECRLENMTIRRSRPLSEPKIINIKQRDNTFRISDGWVPLIHVRPSSTVSWQSRYLLIGKERPLSLGTHPIVSVAEARRKRNDAKRLFEDCIDPSIQKQMNRIEAEVKARISSKEVDDENYQSLVDHDLAPATSKNKR